MWREGEKSPELGELALPERPWPRSSMSAGYTRRIASGVARSPVSLVAHLGGVLWCHDRESRTVRMMGRDEKHGAFEEAVEAEVRLREES